MLDYSKKMVRALFARPDAVCAGILILAAVFFASSKVHREALSDTDHPVPPIRHGVPLDVTTPRTEAVTTPVPTRTVVTVPVPEALAKKQKSPVHASQTTEAMDYEEKVDLLIDRCMDTTDAMTVEMVGKGQMQFTVETLSNMAMLTMEQLAVHYFDLLPEGEDHVSVSIVDDNGNIAGTRVFPRKAFTR